jgi:DHA2 family multidrug resistance protein
LGLAFFFLPLNQIILASIPPNELASASGVSNFFRTMSGSVATAVTVWVWNRRTDYHHAVLTEHVRNSSGGWVTYQSHLSAQGIDGTGALAYVDGVVSSQAATLAVNDVFFMLACAFLALIPFVWMAKPPFGARGAAAASH